MRPFVARGLPLQLRLALYLGLWLSYLGCVAGNDSIPPNDRADIRNILLRYSIAPLVCWWWPADLTAARR